MIPREPRESLAQSHGYGSWLSWRSEQTSLKRRPGSRITPHLVTTSVLGFLIVLNPPSRAADSAQKTQPTPERIGIYDSRAVAYAFFWTAQHQQQLAERVKAAKAAQASGDTAQFKKLDQELAEAQKKVHGQVFSTAPIPEALEALKDRVAAIRKEANVSTLISKWDDAALAQRPGAKQVDITDLLVREFHPGEKQLQTIAEIKKQKPVPLEKLEQIHSAQ